MPAKKKATRKITKRASRTFTVAREMDRHMVTIRNSWATLATIAVREAHRLAGK